MRWAVFLRHGWDLLVVDEVDEHLRGARLLEDLCQVLRHLAKASQAKEQEGGEGCKNLEQ